MTGKELLTREDFLKDIFNNTKIDTEDKKKFLLYFGAILQLGVLEGLIEEAGRNFIANAITKAIEIEVLEDDEEDYNINYVQIRNYMYIISSYLQSKTNWEAFNLLISIKKTEDARILVNHAIEWFFKKISHSKSLLTATKMHVLKLKLRNVSDVYTMLFHKIHTISSCTSNDTNFDVHDYHSTSVGTGTYLLINDSKVNNGENYINNLCNIVDFFCMEISILIKIDAKELFEKKKNEADIFFNNSIKKISEYEKVYKDKLIKLKKEYDKKLIHSKDKIKLNREYLKNKATLENELERYLSELDKSMEEEEIFNNELLSQEYSLYDFVKEYAVYKMALKGEITYPSTINERSMVFMTIDSKKTILEFILGHENILNHEQIKYLKQSI